MAAQRQRCDHGDCEQPAEVFGFPGSIRSKACLRHMLEVIGECEPIYIISAYSFIETVQHVPLYQERKARSKRGKEHLKVLEARCDRAYDQGSQELTLSLGEVQKAIELVSEEVVKRAQIHHQQMKQRLEEKKSNLERLVVDRDFELSTEDAELCQAIPAEGGLRVSLRDCKEQLTQTILAHLQLLPEEALVKVERAVDHRQADQEVAVNADEPRQPAIPLQIPAVREALIKGKTAREEGQYADALRWLQQATAQGEEDLELSLQLGLTHLHFGHIQDAKLELRRNFDPANALSVQVRTALAETYFQAGMWRDVIEECTPILQTWQNSAAGVEQLRALFFLTYSHYQLNQHLEGNAVVDQWTERQDAEGPLCVLSFLLGEKLRALGCKQEAMEQYEDGLQQNQLPDSYITVVSQLSLGMVCEAKGLADEAAHHYFEACSTSTKHFPFSLACANSWAKLSILGMKRLQDPEQTEVQFQRACEVYTTHFPSSLDFADTLFLAGLFCKLRKQPDLAETRWEHACDIYKRISPNSPDYAKCLSTLASHYENVGQFAQAKQSCERACVLYRTVLPDSRELATCLERLAGIHQRMGLDSALQLLLDACQAYRVSASRSTQLAQCLLSLGSFYRARRIYDGAIAVYREAIEIFTERGQIQLARRAEEGLKLCQAANPL